MVDRKDPRYKKAASEAKAVDEEAFIALVKEHKVIYDKTDENYRKNTVRNVVWTKIAEQTSIDSYDNARKHWSALMRTYKANKPKKRPTGSGAKSGETEITWPYFNLMTFLDDYLDEREGHSSNIKDRDPSLDPDADMGEDGERGEGDERGGAGEHEEGGDFGNDGDAELGAEPPRKKAMSEMEDPASPMSTSSATSKQGRKRSRAVAEADDALMEMLKKNQEKIDAISIQPPPKTPTVNELFGQQLALSLDQLSPYDQEIAKFRINQIVFNLRFPGQQQPEPSMFG